MTDDLVTVEIVGLPLDLAARAQEHHDGLTREMTLLTMQLHQQTGESDLPARLVDLVQDFNRSFGSFGETQQRQVEAAVAAGQSTVDLVYRVPPAIADALVQARELQEEVDEYCRRGDHLLTLETQPDVRAYRRWLFDEFIGQVAGRPPEPWRAPAS